MPTTTDSPPWLKYVCYLCVFVRFGMFVPTGLMYRNICICISTCMHIRICIHSYSYAYVHAYVHTYAHTHTQKKHTHIVSRGS